MAKKNNQVSIRNSNVSLRENTTPKVIKPGDTPIPASGLEVSLILMISDEEVVLNGKSFEGGISVNFKREWKEAPELGSFKKAMGFLGNAIGNATLEKDVTDFIGGLPGFLKSVVDALVTAEVILTDLVIDTTGTIPGPPPATGQPQTHLDQYTLGLGLKFTQDVSVGNVKLQAFLVKYTYTKLHTEKTS